MINAWILQHNGIHLSMSGDTPFAAGPLLDSIGLDGEEDGVEDHLDRIFHMDTKIMDKVSSSIAMTIFLKIIKRPTSSTTETTIPDMDTELTIEQYKDVVNKIKEATASSPSVIQYGYYKAAHESQLIVSVHLICMVVPFLVGIPLTRWRRSLHWMVFLKGTTVHRKPTDSAAL